jgi:hypothetical protein
MKARDMILLKSSGIAAEQTNNSKLHGFSPQANYTD